MSGVEWRLLNVDCRSGKCGFMFLMLASAGCGDGIGGGLAKTTTARDNLEVEFNILYQVT